MTINQLSKKYLNVISKIENRKKQLSALMIRHIKLRQSDKKVPTSLIKEIQNLTHRSVMNKRKTPIKNGWKLNGNNWICNGCKN